MLLYDLLSYDKNWNGRPDKYTPRTLKRVGGVLFLVFAAATALQGG